MIEFTTPKMYGLDDTLTQPGYGADAKAVGDALAALEDKADLIKEAPTANLWELEPGIYHISYGFQWGQYEKPINRRYTPITEGICIIGQRTNDTYNKMYTILADNRIYYGKVSKMTATNVNTGELMDVIEGTMDYIEKTDKIDDVTTAKFGVPSSEAVKKYIDSFGLKTLALGNLQKAYIQNLETGIYCVTVEEGGRAGIYAGKSAHHVMDTAYLIIGGSNYTEETADKDGVTRYNKSFILLTGVTNQAVYYAGLIDSEKLDGVWTHTKVGGDVIETKDNKAFAIDETIRDHTKYISALAVKEYVDGAIDGIEVEVPDRSITPGKIQAFYLGNNISFDLQDAISVEKQMTENTVKFIPRIIRVDALEDGSEGIASAGTVKKYVDEQIAKLPTGDIDLNEYAKKSDIPDVSAYQTEEQVIALIEANLPESAEEVEY